MDDKGRAWSRRTYKGPVPIASLKQGDLAIAIGVDYRPDNLVNGLSACMHTLGTPASAVAQSTLACDRLFSDLNLGRIQLMVTIYAMSAVGWTFSALVFLFIWVAIAFWPARVARRKGHSFILYFIFSLIFFPLALIAAYVVQDRAAPAY